MLKNSGIQLTFSRLHANFCEVLSSECVVHLDRVQHVNMQHAMQCTNKKNQLIHTVYIISNSKTQTLNVFVNEEQTKLIDIVYLNKQWAKVIRCNDEMARARLKLTNSEKKIKHFEDAFKFRFLTSSLSQSFENTK